MGLKIRMWLLVVLLFAIFYGIVSFVGQIAGYKNPIFYMFLALLTLFFQYLIGPSMVTAMMRVRWVTEKEEPKIYQMVKELSESAKIPQPKIGISEISIPNAFAFGRNLKDGRVCVTRGLKNLLNDDEMRAVLGHEISHLKHSDAFLLTFLSVIPLTLYWIASYFLYYRGGRDDRERDLGPLIGFGAMLAYFLSNLLVLAISRAREYYADEGSVRIGNPPHFLSSALYKLVRASARLREIVSTEELKRAESLRAFFLNDIVKTEEISDLSKIDKDLSQSIEKEELLSLTKKKIKLPLSEKILTLFSTHPPILSRIERLALLCESLEKEN